MINPQKYLLSVKNTNKYVPNNYYYSGEFGSFNFILLNKLEMYNGDKITIHTFPDYCYIIKNLFGDKFDCKEIKLVKMRIIYDSKEQSNYKKIYKPIYELIKLSKKGENQFDYISKQITTDYSDDSKNFICYFPRFRKAPLDIETDFDQRNASINECKYILNLFSPKFKIFILGNEILNFPYEDYNVEKVSDIKKSIFYLKNCNFLISNDSGYVDFAKNCGCKNIYILRPIVEYHKYFNPFNSNINIINDLNELKNIKV